jgi:hypothetical protein
MTKTPTVRDSEYFLQRLKRDKPSFHADLLAGKYKTITEAAKAAKLMSTRTRLQELKNAFEKATPTEQAEFRLFIGCTPAVTPSLLPASPFAGPVTIGRRLTPQATARIQDIMTRRHLKIGQVMTELGRNSRDASLGGALGRGTRLQPDMIIDLGGWLDVNERVQSNVDQSTPLIDREGAVPVQSESRRLI